MSEQATRYEYDLKKLAEVLVRDQGLTEGLWMPLIRFQHAAATMPSDRDEVALVTINRVTAIGIMRVDEPSPLSVDASEIAAKT